MGTLKFGVNTTLATLLGRWRVSLKTRVELCRVKKRGGRGEGGMEEGREGEVENLLLIAPSPFLARPIGFILFPSIASGRIDTLKLQHMALYYASTRSNHASKLQPSSLPRGILCFVSRSKVRVNKELNEARDCFLCPVSGGEEGGDRMYLGRPRPPAKAPTATAENGRESEARNTMSREGRRRSYSTQTAETAQADMKLPRPE